MFSLLKKKNNNHFHSERAISTRARLIILHDYRLFGEQMHYIWKRFVNIIFVRQYEHNFRGNRSSTNSSAFELTTVPYPMPMNGIFVSKRIDFWRNGKYQHGTKLNMDQTSNLKGKIEIFRKNKVEIESNYFILKFRPKNVGLCLETYTGRVLRIHK